MAKSRSRSTRKRTAAASTRARSRKTSPPKKRRDVVELKSLYEQIGRKILELQALPPGDQAKFAIERLEMCRADFDRMCGPTMDIPRGSMPVV